MAVRFEPGERGLQSYDPSQLDVFGKPKGYQYGGGGSAAQEEYEREQAEKARQRTAEEAKRKAEEERRRLEQERAKAVIEEQKRAREAIREAKTSAAKKIEVAKLKENIRRIKLKESTQKYEAGIITGYGGMTPEQTKYVEDMKKYKQDIAKELEKGKEVYYTPQGYFVYEKGEAPLTPSELKKIQSQQIKTIEPTTTSEKIRTKIARATGGSVQIPSAKEAYRILFEPQPTYKPITIKKAFADVSQAIVITAPTSASKIAEHVGEQIYFKTAPKPQIKQEKIVEKATTSEKIRTEIARATGGRINIPSLTGAYRYLFGKGEYKPLGERVSKDVPALTASIGTLSLIPSTVLAVGGAATALGPTEPYRTQEVRVGGAILGVIGGTSVVYKESKNVVKGIKKIREPIIISKKITVTGAKKPITTIGTPERIIETDVFGRQRIRDITLSRSKGSITIPGKKTMVTTRIRQFLKKPPLSRDKAIKALVKKKGYSLSKAKEVIRYTKPRYTKVNKDGIVELFQTPTKQEIRYFGTELKTPVKLDLGKGIGTKGGRSTIKFIKSKGRIFIPKKKTTKAEILVRSITKTEKAIVTKKGGIITPIKMAGKTTKTFESLSAIKKLKEYPLATITKTGTITREIGKRKVGYGVSRSIISKKEGITITIKAPFKITKDLSKYSTQTKKVKFTKKQAGEIIQSLKGIYSPPKIGVKKVTSSIKPIIKSTPKKTSIQLSKPSSIYVGKQLSKKNMVRNKELTIVKTSDISSKKIARGLKQPIKEKAKEKEVVKIEGKAKEKEVVKIEGKAKEGIKEKQIRIIKPSQKISPKEKVKQESILEERMKQTIQQRSKTTSKKKPLIPIPIPSLSGELKKPLIDFVKKREAFQVLVRRKGIFRPIGKPLPKGRALKLGRKVTTQTLAATFKLTPVGTTQLKDVPIKFDYRFRPPKKPQALTFIQRRKFRLDTAGERIEIQRTRKKKVRKKKDNFFKYMKGSKKKKLKWF